MRMQIIARAAALGAVAAAASAGAAQTALVGAHIIDTEAGALVENQTILIDGDRIIGVQDASAPLPDGAERVDMSGRFALPGLIDSHVHYAAPAVYDPLMVAHGVALVREMGGETETVIALRDERNEAGATGPRMIVTGAIVDGVPPTWPFSEPADTPEDGRAAVRRLHEAGVDLIKVYQNLKPEVHAAVCDEAQALGLMPVGHVPTAITVEQAIDNGQRTIEHLSGFDAMLHRRSHGGENPENFMALGQAWSDAATLDDATIGEIVAPYADPRIAHCPTLAVFDGVRTFSKETEEESRYHPAMMKSFWSSGPYAEWGEAIDRQMPGLLRFAHALHEAGGTILAGTDLANPGVVAGRSLHEEMALLVQAGLSPADALRAATTTPAAFFGIDDLGAIEPGMEATILFLNANPLERIEATREIAAVAHRGEVFDRAALDAMLDDAALAASAEPAVADEQVVLGVPEFEMPGEFVASGEYAYSFGDFDAGREIFRITREGDAHHITAHARFNGGPQPPSVTTTTFGPGFTFVSGAYRLIGREAPPAHYRMDGETVVATAGEESNSAPAPPGAIIAGPSVATEFGALQSLGLAVGKSVTPPYIGFGNPTWRLAAVANTITRLPDGEVEGPGGKNFKTSVYEQVLTIPGMGQVRSTTHLNELGVVVASRLDLPMGSLEIELIEYQAR